MSLFSARIVFGPRFGTLLGSFWEVIWPPGNAETSLLGGLGPSKSSFQLLFWAPRPPKTAPRALQEPSKTAPRGLQQAKKLQEASGEPCGTHLDSILDPIWTYKPSPEGLQTAARRNCRCALEQYPCSGRGVRHVGKAGPTLLISDSSPGAPSAPHATSAPLVPGLRIHPPHVSSPHP